MESYYIDYLYREISLKEEDIEAVPEMGQADDACSIIADKKYIIRQFKDVSFKKLKDTVCKLCDEPEIKSRKDALTYLVWLAALDTKEKRFLSHGAPQTKVLADGFVWLVISSEQARQLWETQVFNLYTLYDDESEGMIETEEDLEDSIRRSSLIGIEVGFLSQLSNSCKIHP